MFNIERISNPPSLLSNANSADLQVLDSGLANLPSKESWSSRSLPSGKYGIIAFGKRLTRHVELFKHAYDLNASGSNKFTVSFCDGSLANKFVDYFNQNRNLIFQDESWLAYIHNYKVIRQFIMRGIDDNDSAEELLSNVRPPPEWGTLWTPPFEINRLKRRVFYE